MFLKRSSRDRIGIVGELGLTGLGVTGGAAVSGVVAGAAGAATLAGSTTLATILGGIFVTTTPVGWIVGSALAGGGLAIAATRLVRSGAKSDVYRISSIRGLESRIAQVRVAAESGSPKERLRELITGIQYLVANGGISQEKSTELLVSIQQQRMAVDDAFDIIQEMVRELPRTEQ